MAVPVPTLRVDWNNDGNFGEAINTVHPLDTPPLQYTRGRSGDFTTDATGQMTFTLDNTDNAYSFDRNWCDNPSFEVNTSGWATAALAGATSAATSITKVTDNAPSAGTSAGEVVLPATSGAGVSYPLPYRFRHGVQHSVAVSLKSVSGSTSIAAGIGASYAAACLATGPVAYWRLGEASGTSAADATGNGHTGTYVASPTLGVAGALTGDSDTAVTLNGSTQYVSVPTSTALNFTGPFTLACWLKTTAATSMLMTKGTTSQFSYAMWINGDHHARLTLWHATNELAYEGVGTAVVDDGAWHFVVAVNDGANMLIYVDGVLGVGSTTVGGYTWYTSSTAEFEIGRRADGYGPLAGSVDEPAAWNRALSAAEVLGLWSAGQDGVTTGAGTITGAWAAYTFNWTPTVDTTAVSFFLRSTAASAATFRVDAVQVNPGPAPNAYIEAPTKGQLVPGRPVHLYATYNAVQYPLFFGYIERITPDLQKRTVTITVYDVLRKFGEILTVVPANAYIQRSARDMRIEVLSDYERGTINLCNNGSVESAITGWSTGGSGGSIARITTDAAPGLGTACAQLTATTNVRAEFALRLVPVVFAGQPYRISVWLKSVSGGTSWTAGIYAGTWTGAGISDRILTTTGAWARYTFTVTTTAAGSASAGFTFFLLASGTGVLNIDGLMVSRGYADPAYTTTVSGRWPNFCGNGSFDGGALNGWYDSTANFCTNGNFETNTSGWSGAGDSFVAASTIARSTAQHYIGAASMSVTSAVVTNNGGYYALTGTFKSGQVYQVSAYCYCGGNGLFGIGSNGTPSDKAQVSTSALASWVLYTTTWTPSSDRSDVHVYFSTAVNTTSYIDAVNVVKYDTAFGSQVWPYMATGPGAGASSNPAGIIGQANRGTSSTAKYGSLSHYVTTPAVAGAGRVYDFNHIGPYFLSGQPYTVSMWVNPTVGGTIRVGMGAVAADGTMDEAYTTPTLTAGVWTQATATWTPSADRSSAAALTVIAYVMQTDANLRTIYIDWVRVIPGSSADNFEQPYWNIPAAAESDQYGASASLSGTALAGLQQLNNLALSRHWISATMSSPYWQYNLQDRNAYAAATSVESYTDGVGTAAQTVAPPELDRQAILNAIAITTTAGPAEYYPSEASVEQYGYRPASALSGNPFFANYTVPALVGAALASRVAQPIRRPTFTVENRWPSQLQRDVNDMVFLTVAAWLLWNLYGNIARLTTTVDSSGQHWKTEYQLEESFGAG